MSQIPVDVPDGVSGHHKIETFIVSKEDVKNNFRGMLRPMEYVPEGTYKRLLFGREVIMSNTSMEINSNYTFMRKATGKVLINGLGIGMVLTEILKKPDIAEVWVVEKFEDVIKLVGPTFEKDPRVKIIHADAMEYKPPKGMKFDCVWHDIWTNMCTDNLEDMKILHRRYANRTKWQGSWQKEYLQSMKRREARSGW